MICIVKYSRSVSTGKLLARDEVRRAYLLNGTNRALGHVFPRTLDGKIWRSFQQNWFDKFDCLEHSVEKDADMLLLLVNICLLLPFMHY